MALIAAGSAACGSAQTTPQGKVQNAFTKLSDQKTVTLGLSFDATPAQIYAALKSDDFTMDDASMLGSLHATVAGSSEQKFSLLNAKTADKSGAFGFSLSSDKAGKTALVEIRGVGQKVYLRADLKSFQKLDTSGNAASDFAGLNSFVDQADQLPSSLGALKAGIKGQWVSIDPKAWAEFAQSMASKYTGSGDSADGTSSKQLQDLLNGKSPVDPKTQAQLVAAVKTAFTRNATYKDLGSKDGADHVQVSVPARQLATDLSTSLPPILKQIPGMNDSDLSGMSDVSGVPNRTVTVDVAVKGGKLSGITFDLMQLDDKPTGAKLPFHLSVDDSADSLTAPAGAQQLNPQDLVSLFMTGPDSSDGSFDSSGSSDTSGF